MLTVLPSEAENVRARATLESEGLSCLRQRRNLVERVARHLPTTTRFGVDPLAHVAREVPGVGLAVGDPLKSWDVLLSVRAIQRDVALDEPILDIGAFRSELPCALRRAGYRALYGIDLDPHVRDMPDGDVVTWVQGDMLDSPFRDDFFSAVTATSVIEHGFDADRLCAEVARLLRPGGIFVASTDYWPSKVDTSDMDLFGMPWVVFSSDELRTFIEDAETYGLVPDGELSFDADERAVHFADRDYTFAWLSLRKRCAIEERPNRFRLAARART